MSQDCLFCGIVAGDIPSKTIYRDDQITAFHDIHPQASVHVLVIPNAHVDSLNQAEELEPELFGRLLQVSAKLAREFGIDQSGYRVVTNTGPDSGQSVFHLHFHLLGGNRLRLPLG